MRLNWLITKLNTNSRRPRTQAAHHPSSRMRGSGGLVARQSSRATRYGITRFATGMNQPPAAQAGDHRRFVAPRAGRLRTALCIHIAEATTAPTRPVTHPTDATNCSVATSSRTVLLGGTATTTSTSMPASTAEPARAAMTRAIAAAARSWAGAYGRDHAGPGATTGCQRCPSQYQRPSGEYCGDALIAAHNIRVSLPHAPVSYLEANAGAGPDRPAVLDAGRTVTFAELRDRVHAAAAALRERGVVAGDVVAVSLPNVWEHVALELAIPLLGAVVMPLPLNLGAAERAWALERSGARLVVEPAEAEALCAAPFRGRREEPPADPGRVVEIALTSGTTGLPKLASLHAGLKQATFEAFTSRLAVTAADRVL